MMEFPGRTKSRRLWAFTTQEIGPAGIAGKARESLYQSLWSQVIARSQYRNAFCGTGLVSLPGLLLPPLPLSVGQITTHVLSSSTLQNSAVPAQYALTAVPLPTEWHLLN